jgi:hypothetical protein
MVRLLKVGKQQIDILDFDSKSMERIFFHLFQQSVRLFLYKSICVCISVYSNKKDLNKYLISIVRAADERSCFGWVQESLKELVTLVGEVRCNKVSGQEMKKYLESGLQKESRLSSMGVRENSTIYRIDTKVYPDTKIKLHFSHFKVLDNRRQTCFRDEPHMCEEENILNSMW